MDGLPDESDVPTDPEQPRSPIASAPGGLTQAEGRAPVSGPVTRDRRASAPTHGRRTAPNADTRTSGPAPALAAAAPHVGGN